MEEVEGVEVGVEVGEEVVLLLPLIHSNRRDNQEHILAGRMLHNDHQRSQQLCLAASKVATICRVSVALKAAHQVLVEHIELQEAVLLLFPVGRSSGHTNGRGMLSRCTLLFLHSYKTGRSLRVHSGEAERAILQKLGFS